MSSSNKKKIMFILQYIILILAGNALCFHKCNELMTKMGFICKCNATYCDTAPNLRPIKNSFYHIITGKDFPGFITHVITLSQNLPIENGARRFTIDFTKKKQSLIGFGGSLTDSFGLNVISLSSSTQNKLLSTYFSYEGLRYSLCRVPMGSSDFSPRLYYYDDAIDDVFLNNFSLQPEDYVYKIEIIKRIQKISPLKVKFITSNWSPPTWMKKSNLTSSSYIKNEYNQLYADYQTRFLEKYKKEGVEFWGITPLNEPITGAAIHTSLNNVIMFPEQQREWIVQHLGPTLMKKGFNEIKIIVLDDQTKYINWWMDTVMEDEKAANYTYGIGLHWYFDAFTSPEMLDIFHQKYPEKYIIYTESSINKMFYGKDLNQNAGIWDRGALYAHSIIEGLNHWNSGWIDWNLALDNNGGPNILGLKCDAPVIVNGSADEFYKQPTFYAIGHFSVFSQPGSAVVFVSEESGPFSRKYKREAPPFPDPFDPVPQKVVEDIYLTATSNPNGSKMIFILNGYPYAKNVSLHLKFSLEEALFVNLTIAGNSLNTFMFW